MLAASGDSISKHDSRHLLAHSNLDSILVQAAQLSRQSSVSHRDTSTMLVPDNKNNTIIMALIHAMQVEGHVAVPKLNFTPSTQM